jgi:hypothetical protein
MSLYRTTIPFAFILPFATAVAQDTPAGARICLAPTKAEMVTGNAETAVNAVRETFTSFLTGPSIGVAPLTARLQSQAREEAKQANCPYVLITSIRHERKEGNKLLRRATGGAIEAGASQVMGTARSATGRIAANAAASVAMEAARDVAYSVKTKDELELTYRLETTDGAALLDKKEKRQAKSDGEDILTPLVERASEAVAAAVAARAK